MLSNPEPLAKPASAEMTPRVWRRLGFLVTVIAIATISLVVAAPFIFLLRCLQEVIEVPLLKDERLCLLPLLVTFYYVPPRIWPWIGYSFGGRSGNRRFGRRVIPESIAFLQFDLRQWLAALLVAQLLCFALMYWGPREMSGQLGRLRANSITMIIPVTCGLLGLAVALFGKFIFMRTRGRKQGVWKVNRRRGIPLRDFIWKWDTTTRQIFERCRISRRVAGAFAAVTLTSSSFYAAMGCLSSIMAPNLAWALAMNLVSLPATAWFWPTPKRLVGWTATIIDRAPRH